MALRVRGGGGLARRGPAGGRAAAAAGGGPRARRACVARLRNIDEPEALLFDCDGVLVDTEKDGHRVAFNLAFAEKGLDHVWDAELYGRLLETGGGKERMIFGQPVCAYGKRVRVALLEAIIVYGETVCSKQMSPHIPGGKLRLI